MRLAATRPTPAALALLVVLAPPLPAAAAECQAAPPAEVAAPAASPAPERPSHGWPDWVPGAAVNAAVYGSLYVAVVGTVSVVGAGLSLVTPPSMLGIAMTFGVPAVTVAIIPRLIPVVTEEVPPRVLAWFGIGPAARSPDSGAAVQPPATDAGAPAPATVLAASAAAADCPTETAAAPLE